MKIFKKLHKLLTKYPRATAICVLSLAAATFLIICLSKISVWSVWFDESFSAFMIQQNFSDIWHYTALDVNAPLYYFLLKSWSFIAGHSDIALRLLSVIFGIGVLISGFFLARRLFGQRIGYFVLLFLTLSPMLLRYATEMRCYTLLIFLLIMATYVFVLANEKSSYKLWLLYGVLIAAAMWTHYYAALPIVAHWLWRAITTKKFFTLGSMGSLMFAGVLFLPWLPVVKKQFNVIQDYGFWIEPFGLDTIGNFFGEMMMYSTYERASIFVMLALVVVLILATILIIQSRRILTKKLRPNILLILLIVFLPVLILAVLSIMPSLKPMFINRYVIFSMVMFSFIIALAVGVKLKSRMLRTTQMIFLVLMLVLSTVGIRNVLHFGNYNFDTNSVSMVKSLMVKIANESSENTIIIAENPWIFYDAVVYASDKNPVYFLDSSTEYEYGSLAMLQADSTHKIMNLEKFVLAGQKVWFVGLPEDDVLLLPADNWKLLRSISVADPIDGNVTSAAEYLVE